ncbi:MAG: fibronectin type III domain-containing protein [Leptospirillia bacterium]
MMPSKGIIRAFMALFFAFFVVGTAAAQTPTTEPIVWTDLVGTTDTAGTLSKTAVNGWGNGGAASTQTIPADGAVEFTAVSTVSWRFMGLSDVNTSAGWETIDYAIWARGDGAFSVYENGFAIGEFGTYASGDVFRVERSGSTVFYQHNGITFYTSTTPSAGDLIADASIYDQGAEIVGGTIHILGAAAIDVTPPVFSNVQATVVGADRVRITWDTDEPATSQVHYGLATIAENVSAFDPALTLSHSVLLTGLAPESGYVFQAESQDFSGNLGNSGTPGVFLTSAASGGIGAVWTDLVGTSASGATLTKTALDGWGNGGAASFQTIPGDGAIEFTAFDTHVWRFVGLSNFNASSNWDTIAYAIWVRGDSVVSVFENGAMIGEFGTYVSGDVFRVERTGSTVAYLKNGATIYTSTEPSSGDLVADVSIYNQGASILDAVIIGAAPDVSAPLISNVASAVVGLGSVTVTWQTNEPATSQVMYGLLASNENASALDNSLVTDHSVTLTGLDLNALYLFHVESRDGVGNLVIGTDNSFFTEVDSLAPVISNVMVSGIGAASATVTWDTDEPSTSQVHYGIAATTENSSTLDINPVTSHSVTLTGLTPATMYLFRVESSDASNNTATNLESTFSTIATGDEVSSISWTDLVGVAVSGSTLTKTAGNGWGNGGAASVQTIAGNGAVAFTASDTTTWRLLGLSASNASASWDTIGYAIWARGDGTLQVLENGVSMGNFGAYQTGDVLKVQRTGSTITYLRNGAVFHTSLVPSTGGLVADAALYDQGASIVNALIFGAGPDTAPPVIQNVATTLIGVGSASVTWQTNEPATSQVLYGIASVTENNTPVDGMLVVDHQVLLTGLSADTTYKFRVQSGDAAVNVAIATGTPFTTLAQAPVGVSVLWTDLVGTSGNGGTLTKDAADGWGTGGAASSQVIPADGAFEFRVATASTWRFAGLSSSNASANWDTIDYGIWARGDSSLQVFESGTPVGAFGGYQSGDLLRVERVGSTVYYKRNGAVFYTSLVPSSGDLIADTALFDQGARVTDGVMFGVDFEMISTDSARVQGNGNSLGLAASGDGRYVAFLSNADNLVAGDANGTYDVFVKDLASDVTLRVSTEELGVPGNNDPTGSLFPSISSDGRYVAFQSYLDNVVAGDTNGYSDVFVKDLASGIVARASVNALGAESNFHSGSSSLSGDGRYVAFTSRANNLVAGDNNGKTDVFIKDMVSGAIVRVVPSGVALEADGDSDSPVMSANGTYLVFESSATNLVAADSNLVSDVFLYNRLTGTVSLVSESGGVAGNGGSGSPSVSADGRYVVFSSSADNLVPGDTNLMMDVFVKDTVTGAMARMAASAAGAMGDGASFDPAVSADGRYVVFWSTATNLVSGDTNGVADVFVKDRVSGEITRVSTDFAGVEGVAGSLQPGISGDGGHVFFESYADTLVSGDLNGLLDVFVTLNPLGQ